MNFIETKDVVKQYDGHLALDRVSINVPQGCVFGLLGPNGAGKTSLIRILNMITRADSGEVLFGGHPLHEKDIANIGYLPEERGLYRKMKEDDRAVCEWWMDIFGIAGLKERNFLQLSSGEQRMVLLARAFVKDPELLILDEPLHGLDMLNRRLVKDIIETFCERKDKTMIMVTHYKEELPSNITHSLYLKRN